MKIQAHGCFFRTTVDKAGGTCHTPQNEDVVTLSQGSCWPARTCHHQFPGEVIRGDSRQEDIPALIPAKSLLSVGVFLNSMPP